MRRLHLLLQRLLVASIAVLSTGIVRVETTIRTIPQSINLRIIKDIAPRDPIPGVNLLERRLPARNNSDLPLHERAIHDRAEVPLLTKGFQGSYDGGQRPGVFAFEVDEDGEAGHGRVGSVDACAAVVVQDGAERVDVLGAQRAAGFAAVVANDDVVVGVPNVDFDADAAGA